MQGKGFSKAEPGMFIGGVLAAPNAYMLGRVSPGIYRALKNGGLNEAQTLLVRKKTQHALGLFFTIERSCVRLWSRLPRTLGRNTLPEVYPSPSCLTDSFVVSSGRILCMTSRPEQLFSSS
jgi:hypothetical protein